MVVDVASEEVKGVNCAELPSRLAKPTSTYQAYLVAPVVFGRVFATTEVGSQRF